MSVIVKLKRVRLLWRLAIKKIYIRLWIKKTILQNKLIQEDAGRGMVVYQSKRTNISTYQKVEHMLINYPAFAFQFRFRSGVRSKRFERLFMPAPFAAKIFSSTPIGGGLACFHPYATVINAKTIGKNFTFRNGLTIGNKSDDNRMELPTIGDDVEVGANVVIIGEITIGNNVSIGAGSVVVKDVPDNAIIAGNPARIIRYK
jgi:serine O-acetyltransferase